MGSRKELWDMCRARPEIISAIQVEGQLVLVLNLYGGLGCYSDCLGTSFE